MTFEERVGTMFDWEIDAPLYSSLIVILLLIILCVVCFFRFRRAMKKEEYKQPPRGFLLFAEWYYDFVHKFTINNMGEVFEGFTVYFMALFAYLFVSFMWGLTGLPSIIDWLAGPLCLSLVMFVIIQVVAIKYNKWRYFHRFIEPFPFFLPINMITMWAPIISTTMRMFGNCLSGTIIIGLVQWALGSLSGKIFGSLTMAAQMNYFPAWDVNHSTVWTQIFLAPIPMGVLNLYFSLFTSVIQTLVFAMLNALWIAQERPEDAPTKKKKQRKSLVQAEAQ